MNMNRYDLSKTTIGQLLADEEAVAIIERYRPGLAGSQGMASMADLRVDEAIKLAKRHAKPGEIEKACAELEAL